MRYTSSSSSTTAEVASPNVRALLTQVSIRRSGNVARLDEEVGIEVALERLTLFAPDDAAQRKYRKSRMFCETQGNRWRDLHTKVAWNDRSKAD